MTAPLPFARLEFLTSKQNPKFKIWKSLLQAKGRKTEKLFLLSGEKIILDFFNKSGNDRLNKKKSISDFQISAILFPDNEALYLHFMNLINGSTPSDWRGDDKDSNQGQKMKAYRLSADLFNELDTVGTHFCLVVLTSKEFKGANLNTPPVGLELVCPISDPSNLGAICRSAYGFGVKKLILTKNSADPYHPKSLKSSSGVALQMQFERLDKELSQIQPNQISEYDVGLDLLGTAISEYPWPKNLRLWLGEEGQGLKIIPRAQCLFIPTQGIESLNVTVAGSIALYLYQSSRNK
jgi:TrmH family RNA methyltransferase